LVGWLNEGRRRLRLWSAGCGTGEEAYGMALTALGAMEAAKVGLHEVDVKILATDLSKAVLERGKQGVFDDEQLRDVPRTVRGRYFRVADNGFAVDEHVRDLVRLRRLNLSKLPYPMTGPLDAIFCHEGLQPLVPSARDRVTSAVKALVTEDGLLCTGFDDDALDISEEDADQAGFLSSGDRIRHGHC
jgi:chemotaxis protein methyltransferase CheR